MWSQFPSFTIILRLTITEKVFRLSLCDLKSHITPLWMRPLQAYTAFIDLFSSFIRALFCIILLKWQNGNSFLFCVVNGNFLLLLDSLYNYIFFRPKSIWLSLVCKWSVISCEPLCERISCLLTPDLFNDTNSTLSHKRFAKALKCSRTRVALVHCCILI